MIAADAGRAVGVQQQRAGLERELGPVVAARADLDRVDVRAVARVGAPGGVVEAVLGDDDHRARRRCGWPPWRRAGILVSTPAADSVTRSIERRAACVVASAPGTGRAAGRGPGPRPGAAVGGRAGRPPRSGSRAARSAADASRERHVGGEAEPVAVRPRRAASAPTRSTSMSSAPARTMPLVNGPPPRRARARARRAARRARRAWPPGRRRGGSRDRASAARRRNATGAVPGLISSGEARGEAVRGRAPGTGSRGRRPGRGPGSGPGTPGCRWWRAGRPRSRPRRTRRPCGRRTRRPRRTRRRSGRRSGCRRATRRGGGDRVRSAALDDARGDLRAVAADELRRQVGADVDAGGDGRGGVLEGHDVALAGAEVRVVVVEGVRAERVGDAGGGAVAALGLHLEEAAVGAVLGLDLHGQAGAGAARARGSPCRARAGMPQVSVSPRWSGTLPA